MVECAPRTGFLPSPDHGRRIWVVPGRDPESIKIPACPHYPPKPPKSCPGSPKASKMRSQSDPEHPQITNKPEKWNPTETPRLPWFKHIRASDSGVISTPKSLKDLPWNPHCHFATSKHEKVTKMTPKWSQRGTQNPPKIDKNQHLGPKVPCWVPLGATMVQREPKWCPRVSQWCLQASQMATLGTQSDTIQHPASPACPASPASPACPRDSGSPANPTCLGNPANAGLRQSPIDRRGRRQGRSLKISAALCEDTATPACRVLWSKAHCTLHSLLYNFVYKILFEQAQ
jgi:hypothetical protein